MVVNKEDIDIQSYLSKPNNLIAEFEAHMPFMDVKNKHVEQRHNFFTVFSPMNLTHGAIKFC